MNRVDRRLLVKAGRKSGDPATALRFHIVARLGLGRTSPRSPRNWRSHARRSCARRIGSPRRASRGCTISGAATGSPRSATPSGAGSRSFSSARRSTSGGADRRGPASCSACRCRRTAGRRSPCAPWAARWRPSGLDSACPKPIVLCPWKRDVREARLAELRALEAGATAAEPVLYSDEVDVHLNPKIGRDPAGSLPSRGRRRTRHGRRIHPAPSSPRVRRGRRGSRVSAATGRGEAWERPRGRVLSPRASIWAMTRPASIVFPRPTSSARMRPPSLRRDRANMTASIWCGFGSILAARRGAAKRRLSSDRRRRTRSSARYRR